MNNNEDGTKGKKRNQSTRKKLPALPRDVQSNTKNIREFIYARKSTSKSADDEHGSTLVDLSNGRSSGG
jgi:hypothetical protein